MGVDFACPQRQEIVQRTDTKVEVGLDLIVSTHVSTCQPVYHCLSTRLSTPIMMDCQPINADQRTSTPINSHHQLCAVTLCCQLCLSKFVLSTQS